MRWSHHKSSAVKHRQTISQSSFTVPGYHVFRINSGSDLLHVTSWLKRRHRACSFRRFWVEQGTLRASGILSSVNARTTTAASGGGVWFFRAPGDRNFAQSPHTTASSPNQSPPALTEIVPIRRRILGSRTSHSRPRSRGGSLEGGWNYQRSVASSRRDTNFGGESEERERASLVPRCENRLRR